VDFDHLLDQAIEMLQRHGRLTYHTLKRQLELDDDDLDDLKDAILYAHPVSDDGRGLVWAGEIGPPEPNARCRTDKRHFQALLPAVILLLRHDRRVTYSMLKYVFSINETLLEGIRKELAFRRLAIDEDGEGLVWVGEATTSVQPLVPVTKQQDMAATAVVVSPASPAPPPHVAATDTRTNGPQIPPEDSLLNGPPDAQHTLPERVRSASAAERRQLTVMFCDLVGSTDLSGRLDPEDLREVVRAYQETAAEVIERYEGHIAQYLGDGLLIYFGFPVAHEDDAQRAVYTGLGIVEAMDTLNTRLKADYGVELALRIGIHTGPVVVGEMGGGDRHEDLALGETPNIAARLEVLAQPNTEVISPTTAQLVQRSFVLEELGLHELKGVAEPMQLYAVVRPREVENNDHEARLAGGFDSLVGRDEEIGLLLRRWEQSKEGLGQVVLLSGEAGIGKSSLVATVRRHVVEVGYTRITFRCSPYHTNSALYPVIEHLHRILRWRPDIPTEKQIDALERFLRGLTLPLKETIPLLAALLSLPLLEGRYPALPLSPQQRRQQTYDVLVTYLMEEAEHRPVLVIWEDLHWSDPSTLELLGLLIDQAPTVPMLQVLTFRPEFAPPWPMRSHMTPLTLNRLERPQVKAMVAHLAGGKALPSEVIEHVVAKTDGVPLFVEELTKMLLESALLSDEGDHYALTGPLSTVSIPATLQDSLMARLDRLPTVRVVAQLGSVIGREFDYEMVQALAGVDETTLQEGLAQLVEAELLYQRGRPPRSRYVYKHALVQDVAYASLLRSTRRQYHQRVAQLLETRFPDTVNTEPELVAYHYTAAGLIEEAIPYWQRAGERANDRAANTEAQRHLTQGLELVRALPETPERLQSELALQTILGRVLTAAKSYGDAEVAQVYTRARQLCQQIGDTPQLFPVLLGLSIYFVVRAELHTARELGEQLLNLAQQAQAPVLLVEAHYSLGVTFSWLGEFELARAHLEQGNAHYDPEQHPDHLALYGQDGGLVCLCRLAFVLWNLGYPDQALARCHEALTMAQRLSHPFSLAYVLTWVAMLYNHCQPLQNTREWADTAVTFSKEQGFPFWYTQGDVLQGWLVAEQGQYADGISQMRQGLADMQAVGTEVIQSYDLGLLARAYDKVGQPEEGLMCIEQALTRLEANDERWPEAELHRIKGELLLQRASPQQEQAAEASFRQAIRIAQRQQAKSPELRAAISLSQLWQSQSKTEEARQLLAEVYHWFTEGFDTVDLQVAKALLETLT
jgi:class 3 adenylate cyclase/predicted ATPase